MDRIKVMVVDDSAFMRKVISDILSRERGMEVVATARDGVEALEKLHQVEPDVVLLDVEMPRMDGLTFLEQALSEKPLRIVMLSALTGEGSQVTLEALEKGALDFIQKPGGSISLDIEKKADEIVNKIKAIALVPSDRLLDYLAEVKKRAKLAPSFGKKMVAQNLILVASSTGGPRALGILMENMKPLERGGMVLIQHMPVGFTRGLAERLNQLSPVSTKEAEEGAPILTNSALIAPGGKHLLISEEKKINLNDDPPLKGLKPCADISFLSAISAFHQRILAVVLTGMGKDGLEGCRAIKKAGGKVIAQDEKSSLIFGMPRAVIEAGLADQVLPLARISQAIWEWEQKEAERDEAYVE